MLAWTAEAALACERLDRVLLTTDDEAIADVGRDCGLDVPRLRDPALATDEASSIDVLLDAVEMAGGADAHEFLVELQPTSPLRTTDDIDACIDVLTTTGADCVYTVCLTDHPPSWCNTLPPDGSMRDFFPRDDRAARSQDLPTTYRITGAVQIFRIDRLVRQRSLVMDDRTQACIVPRERSVDVDDAVDFDIADCLLRRRLREDP